MAVKDSRRRNSFAFYMTAYVKKSRLKMDEENDDDFDPLKAIYRNSVVKVFEDFKREKDDQNPMKGKKLKVVYYQSKRSNIIFSSL